MDTEELRELLALNVESTAEWRSQKAVDFPNDARNAAAANELRRVAQALRGLPSHDPDLRKLWWEWFRPRAPGREDDNSYWMSEAESDYIRGIGFRGSSGGDAGEFLRGLHEALDAAQAEDDDD